MNLTPDAVHAGEAEDPDDAPAASSGQNRPAGLAVPAPGSPGKQISRSNHVATPRKPSCTKYFQIAQFLFIVIDNIYV